MARREVSKNAMRMGGGGFGGGSGGGGGSSSGGRGRGGGMGGGCYIYDENQQANPRLVNADVRFNRGIYMNGSMTMDDGTTVRIWGFTEGGGGMGMGGSFPSPAIRVTEGQIVHTNLSVPMCCSHTIHHHGIEPDKYSDGVGHITWDVSSLTYTYQWKASHAGTYFYHCHTNTVLHAEMGMYGALIIDPPEGPGTLYSGGRFRDAPPGGRDRQRFRHPARGPFPAPGQVRRAHGAVGRTGLYPPHPAALRYASPGGTGDRR